MRRLKAKTKHIKRKTLRHIHSVYFMIQKMPWPMKYWAAWWLIIFGFASLINPLVPGRLLLSVGIGIFSPKLYKKLIGKHARTKKFDDIIAEHVDKIGNVLTAKKTKKSFVHFNKLFKRKLLKRMEIKRKKRKQEKNRKAL